MSTLEMKAHAKINLSLDVLGKRPDGYHDLRMIMQSIELHDTVILQEEGRGITIECDGSWVPSDARNTAYKAAALLMERYAVPAAGLKIRIRKRIPVAAGLAGGSADAAAVLRGMNELFGLGLTVEELMAAGKQVGADVPYCVRGGTMLAEGIGEVLTELAPFKGVPVVLLKPAIGVSTAWVYRNLDLGKVRERPETERLIDALQAKDIGRLTANMRNVLETVTIPEHPIVQEAKDRLVEWGAAGSMMSGSGPTVFGIFTDEKAAADAVRKAGEGRWECWLTHTI